MYNARGLIIWMKSVPKFTYKSSHWEEWVSQKYRNLREKILKVVSFEIFFSWFKFFCSVLALSTYTSYTYRREELIKFHYIYIYVGLWYLIIIQFLFSSFFSPSQLMLYYTCLKYSLSQVTHKLYNYVITKC